MKLAIKWDAARARTAGRDRLDALFLPRIAALLTPKASLHAFKASEADRVLADGTSALLAPEAEARGMSEVDLARAIKEHQAALASEVAAIDIQRQAAQAEIHAAATPAAIEMVLAKYAAQLAAAYPAVTG